MAAFLGGAGGGGGGGGSLGSGVCPWPRSPPGSPLGWEPLLPGLQIHSCSVEQTLVPLVAQKYLIHRMFLVGKLRQGVQDGEIIAYHEQLFQQIYKFHLGEAASGVVLIYPSCILHVIEASSGTLYHILKDLANFEKKGAEALLQSMKVLVLSHNIPTWLFSQWYATPVEVPESLEDATQGQTTEEVLTECLTLLLKMGVYLATKVGNKGLSDCLHRGVPELLILAETVHRLCQAPECWSPAEFLQTFSNPLQPSMDSETVWPTPAHMLK